MGVALALLFSFIAEILKKVFSKIVVSLPMIVAYVGIIVLSTVAFLATSNSLISGIEVTVPAQVLLVWGWFMPTNTTSVLITLYSAKILKWTYIRHLSIVKTKTIIMANK